MVFVLGSCAIVEEREFLRSSGLELGCAVGDVTHDEALVWVKTEGPQEVRVLYMTDDPHWIVPKQTLLTLTNADRDFTAHFPLVNLTPRTHYFYQMSIAGKRRGPICEFVTAPLPHDHKSMTFVIGGDTRNSFKPFSIFKYIWEAEPDFFVYLGDTIYADKEQTAIALADYWTKYKENRDGYMQQLFATTPIFVMWDDHDVDNDFTMNHRRMPIGRQAFF
jgi:phosphodiesterase/alkaline phosphatase D-like protein